MGKELRSALAIEYLEEKHGLKLYDLFKKMRVTGKLHNVELCWRNGRLYYTTSKKLDQFAKLYRHRAGQGPQKSGNGFLTAQPACDYLLKEHGITKPRSSVMVALVSRGLAEKIDGMWCTTAEQLDRFVTGTPAKRRKRKRRTTAAKKSIRVIGKVSPAKAKQNKLEMSEHINKIRTSLGLRAVDLKTGKLQ